MESVVGEHTRKALSLPANRGRRGGAKKGFGRRLEPPRVAPAPLRDGNRAAGSLRGSVSAPRGRADAVHVLLLRLASARRRSSKRGGGATGIPCPHRTIARRRPAGRRVCAPDQEPA